MSDLDIEKLINDLSERIKSGRDISQWQNDHRFAPIANLLIKLNSFPKAAIPTPNFETIKSRMLDRISVPASMEATAERSGFWVNLPYLVKMFSGVMASLLVVASLGIGTAVAALQSVPGDAIYPLKKVVENVELALATNNSQKADLQIQFANNRLDELTQVLAKNQAGEISGTETQKIVAQTITDLQQQTAAALTTTSQSNNSQPKVSALSKIVDLSNKQVAVLQPLLSAASVNQDGDVKNAVQQAIQSSLDSKQQAIQNMENAGVKVEDQPLTIPDSNNVANANGKITAIDKDSITVGTSTFLLTKDTQYVNITSSDLKVDTVVQISGQIKADNKTYALIILPGPVDNSQNTDTNSNTNTDTKTTNDNTTDQNTNQPTDTPSNTNTSDTQPVQ